jgi:hypothetical protein
MARRIALVGCALVGTGASALATYATVRPARDGWVLRTQAHRLTAVVDDFVLSLRWCWFHTGTGAESDAQVCDFPRYLPEHLRIRAHRYSCSFPGGLAGRPGYRSYTYVTVDLPVWLPPIILVSWPLARMAAAAFRYAHRRRNRLCLVCGYALHGLREARCPECGTQAETFARAPGA